MRLFTSSPGFITQMPGLKLLFAKLAFGDVRSISCKKGEYFDAKL
jgi:hypothetical protein